MRIYYFTSTPPAQNESQTVLWQSPSHGCSLRQKLQKAAGDTICVVLCAGDEAQPQQRKLLRVDPASAPKPHAGLIWSGLVMQCVPSLSLTSGPPTPKFCQLSLESVGEFLREGFLLLHLKEVHASCSSLPRLEFQGFSDKHYWRGEAVRVPGETALLAPCLPFSASVVV